MEQRLWLGHHFHDRCAALESQRSRVSILEPQRRRRACRKECKEAQHAQELAPPREHPHEVKKA
eukprot:CAMPEP_0174695732 /NCGR_PEP_ID=MMETSP1094-20130205/2046_1 /TAXON_ID=156173 /ORGANISM="Chrysochromulina brevifilum, Strain UTEX LB 985" /LENGTH=63 /DNA_ID=CAMNT_0015892305 /DNA_START=650 /DNA_END=837 /DNA_ORIENTATION=-